MNKSSEFIIDLFALSGGFWLLFSFYTSFRIRRFIVKRYEQETDLLNSIYFKEHATFTRYLPIFFIGFIHLTSNYIFVGRDLDRLFCGRGA